MKKPPLGLRVMRRTLRGMPPKRYEVAYEPDLAVPAADGSVLLTDHYFPAAEGAFPTVLIRSPYGRGFPWASMYAMPLAEQGFHVVIQSSRGTGGSGGEFHLWRNEAADGQAAVAWLREQSWFSGVLGTIGPSYLGYVQWALALDPPPELRAMVVQVPLHSAHRFYWSGGAFCLESALIGAMGLVNQSRGLPAFLRGAIRLQRNFRTVGRSLPLKEAYPPGLGERVEFLDGAMAHPDADDPYWHGADVGAVADRLSVPTSLISGWYDLNLDQALDQYGRLRRAGCETSLLIGPWTHNSALEQGWPEVFAESLAWLRAHLCDDRSALRSQPVRVHVGGAGEWCDLPGWPTSPAGRRWHLAAGGALAADVPAVAGQLVSFRYDPADPTPSVGGQLLSRKGGARDNGVLEARPDVLTFTTEPLSAPVEVLGPVLAELRVGVSAESADIFARLCDVDPRGRSTNVCDGLLRLARDGDDPASVTVAMSATAHNFRAGHRLRLQLSGGAHPRFARNTGTREPVATATRLVPVDVAIHHPSALVLPTVGDKAAVEGS